MGRRRRLTVNSAIEAGLDQITGESLNDPDKVGLKREIGLVGGVTINVGNIIGSGIFLTPKGVFMGVGSVGGSLVIWAISGMFSLIGALCFAELGLSIPSSGGHYAYIKAAFGDLLSFLYIWISMVLMLPAQQAVICMVFGQYLLEAFLPAEDPCYAMYVWLPTVILCNICVGKQYTNVEYINVHFGGRRALTQIILRHIYCPSGSNETGLVSVLTFPKTPSFLYNIMICRTPQSKNGFEFPKKSRHRILSCWITQG